jgi:hypothetical protein
MWHNDEITITLPAEVAIVVYEMIERYYDAAKPELVTGRAEWRALVLLSGALERSGLVHSRTTGNSWTRPAARLPTTTASRSRTRRIGGHSRTLAQATRRGLMRKRACQIPDSRPMRLQA